MVRPMLGHPQVHKQF